MISLFFIHDFKIFFIALDILVSTSRHVFEKFELRCDLKGKKYHNKKFKKKRSLYSHYGKLLTLSCQV